jgi:hypothetical protein
VIEALLSAATPIAFGLHLSSVHVPQRDHHNNDNLGGYVRVADWQVGGYRNSIDRNTFYVGHVTPLTERLDIVVGAATGYQKRCTEAYAKTGTYTTVEHRPDGSTVTAKGSTLERRDICSGFSRGAVTPLLGFTYTSPVQVLSVTPRLAVVPGFGKASTVVNLMLEF